MTAEDLGDEAVHYFFGLSYANYLVLHRSALQSMPAEWQRKFVDLVEELNDEIVWPDSEVQSFAVSARGSGGKFVRDPVPHYNRGRTQMQLRGGIGR